MPLYWSSWEEYVDHVHPSTVHSKGTLTGLALQSAFEAILEFADSRVRLQKCLTELRELGYNTPAIMTRNPGARALDDAHRAAVGLIRAGEELLLSHRRLAGSDAAYGFLHSNDLPNHWDRYVDEGGPVFQIHQLYNDAALLNEGLTNILKEDEEFLLADLHLPPPLEDDFRTARDLFSLGFDEIALFAALRGLERVLRDILERRGHSVAVKGETVPVSELTLNDLIEGAYRARWRDGKTRLIDEQVRALLHYLRTRRNTGAHPSLARGANEVSARETAVIVSRTANSLWKKHEQDEGAGDE